MRAKPFAAVAAVLLILVLGGCKGDDVDTNPGKGNDGIGNPAKPGDQGKQTGDN